MPICVAREPELAIEIPSKPQVSIPSQYPLGMTTSRYIGQEMADATRHTESIQWSPLLKPASSKRPATEFALRIAGAANSRRANLANYFIKPRGF